jgi:hypothetical protein
MKSIAGAISAATLVAGTLDLTAALISARVRGQTPGGLLRAVAAGPFGDAIRDAGIAGAAAGMEVHFGIMAVIATVFMFAARRVPTLAKQPVRWGLLYGVSIYIVMELIVLPLRWSVNYPILEPAHIFFALTFMTVLVGLPIALIANLAREKRVRDS